MSNTRPDSTWQRRALDKYYYDRPGWTDGTTQFHDLIKSNIEANAIILELGAGPTNKTTKLLASLGDVTGVDIDPAVKSNHHCKEAIVYDGVYIPCDNHSFDLAVSNYVFEHVEYPLQLCQEIHRVLRPKGHFIFRTPNLWHYISFVAKLTPHWFHDLVANRLRNMDAESHKPYPTFHRMNTRKSCFKYLTKAGFNIVLLKNIETEPSYAMASRFLFYPLMIWERVLNSSLVFENLRSNILCVACANKKMEPIS